MLAIIDNYDSFTYNLVQAFGTVAPSIELRVFRNDSLTVSELAEMKPSHIVISPGPCTPREGGISNDVIREFGQTIPLLGVCLGHQCIGFVHGARIGRADRIMHGKTDRVHHDGKSIFRGLPTPIVATRYHSLVIERATLPPEFIVTARTDRDEIMGIRHKRWPLEGVQFHPESYLTECGAKLLGNFLRGK